MGNQLRPGLRSWESQELAVWAWAALKPPSHLDRPHPIKIPMHEASSRGLRLPMGAPREGLLLSQARVLDSTVEWAQRPHKTGTTTLFY